MSGKNWNMNLRSLGAFRGAGLLMCVMQCVGGSREGTDECVRETKIPSASSPPWQLVVLTISSSSGRMVEEGSCLENIRRVADVPALIADPDLGLPLNIRGRNKPHQEAARMPQGYP